MGFWKNRPRLGWLWGTLAGIGFLIIGTMQDQPFLIWQKAIRICLECIGIG